MTFSDRYKPSVRFAFVWVALLTLWCGFVLDMGESLSVFLCSLGAYTVLLTIVSLRRPAEPTKLDLLIIKWGLPILFFSGLFFYPLIWHLRGIYY